MPQLAEYNVTVTGLYLLAKPSTPEAARDMVASLIVRWLSLGDALHRPLTLTQQSPGGQITRKETERGLARLLSKALLIDVPTRPLGDSSNPPTSRRMTATRNDAWSARYLHDFRGLAHRTIRLGLNAALGRRMGLCNGFGESPNFSDPELSLAKVALSMSISPRYLQRLLESSGILHGTRH
jgi:hypothetical protein